MISNVTDIVQSKPDDTNTLAATARALEALGQAVEPAAEETRQWFK